MATPSSRWVNHQYGRRNSPHTPAYTFVTGPVSQSEPKCDVSVSSRSAWAGREGI